MQMDMAISFLDLLKELSPFRENGYHEYTRTIKVIAEKSNIIPHFPQRRVARSKRQFNYKSVDVNNK